MLNHNHDNYVNVELIGGLGDRLFQYSTGLFYTRSISKKLRVDLSFVKSGMTIHSTNVTYSENDTNSYHRRVTESVFMTIRPGVLKSKKLAYPNT